MVWEANGAFGGPQNALLSSQRARGSDCNRARLPPGPILGPVWRQDPIPGGVREHPFWTIFNVCGQIGAHFSQRRHIDEIIRKPLENNCFGSPMVPLEGHRTHF